MNQAIEKRNHGQESVGLALVQTNNSLAKLNMRELKDLAEIFVASGAFPDIKSIAQAQLKILCGHELGFTPIVSMMGVHFFNGKVSLGANLISSLIKDSGKYEYKIVEHTDKACSVQFFQVIKDEIKSLGVAVRYTWEDAQKAQLTGKDNWKKYPQDMLFAACIRQGARRYCADILRGVTPESDNGEAEETVDRSAFDNEAETPVVRHEGESVDTSTGEVIEGEIVDDTEHTSSQRSQPEGQSAAGGSAAENAHSSSTVTGPVKTAVDLANGDTDLLADVNELFKIKCGDGETIDEDEALKVLKGRDLSQLNTAGLEKLKGELAAL